jgi:hypothetical protein
MNVKTNSLERVTVPYLMVWKEKVLEKFSLFREHGKIFLIGILQKQLKITSNFLNTKEMPKKEK